MITYPMYLITKIVYRVFDKEHTEHLHHHTAQQAKQYAQTRWNTAVVLSTDTYIQPALYNDVSPCDFPF